MLGKPIPVYRDGELIGHVSPSATSIGAAKLAKTATAQFRFVDGRGIWEAK